MKSDCHFRLLAANSRPLACRFNAHALPGGDGIEMAAFPRRFNLEYCNVFVKDNVWRIRCAYEECE